MAIYELTKAELERTWLWKMTWVTEGNRGALTFSCRNNYKNTLPSIAAAMEKRLREHAHAYHYPVSNWNFQHDKSPLQIRISVPLRENEENGTKTLKRILGSLDEYHWKEHEGIHAYSIKRLVISHFLEAVRKDLPPLDSGFLRGAKPSVRPKAFAAVAGASGSTLFGGDEGRRPRGR